MDLESREENPELATFRSIRFTCCCGLRRSVQVHNIQQHRLQLCIHAGFYGWTLQLPSHNPQLRKCGPPIALLFGENYGFVLYSGKPFTMIYRI